MEKITKLPSITAIFKNRNDYTEDDISTLKELATKEKARLEKTKMNIDKKIDALKDINEVIEFCEMRFTRVVDSETLEVTGESTDYAKEAGIITDEEESFFPTSEKVMG